MYRATISPPTHPAHYPAGCLISDPSLAQAAVEERLLPMTNAYRLLPRPTVARFLTVQTAMVALIWFLKQSRR